MDDYFKTSSFDSLKITPEQSSLAGKNIQLVKGSDYHKSVYDIKDKNYSTHNLVRYYQIASFDEFGKCAIRSFLFKGTTSSGACFYDYTMLEIKDYMLAKDLVDNFVNFLNSKIAEIAHRKKIGRFKKDKTPQIMYKFYPVYNFNYTNPPTGNDINECQSDLLS